MTKNESSCSSGLQLLGLDNDQGSRNDISENNKPKIDFILVYEETHNEEKTNTREIYEKNLKRRSLKLEHVSSSQVDEIFLLFDKQSDTVHLFLINWLR